MYWLQIFLCLASFPVTSLGFLFPFLTQSSPAVVVALPPTSTSSQRVRNGWYRIRGGSLQLSQTSSQQSFSNETLSDYNATTVDAGSLPMQDLWDKLKSSPRGLSEEQVKQRLELFGPNTLAKEQGKSLFSLILEQFEDRLVQILLVVAALSAVFSFAEVQQASEEVVVWKAFVEPIIILTILVLNAVVGVWQSRSASDSLKALQEMQPSLATVLRDGRWRSGVSATELVPGDILEVRVGDKIPADARFIKMKSSSFQVDEGSLTGESVTVGKYPGDEGTVEPNLPVQDQKGMLYSGTMVTSGTGLAVVVQTGMATQFGKIQQGVTEAKASQSKTPLAIKLDEFGDSLTLIIGAICLAVWCVSIPKFNDPSFGTVWEGAVYYAKVAVALGVAAIPEGLPAVITLCLSLGTRRMAERNVIVRKLQSVETLGCVSVICTDKTGTLTTNEMTVLSLVIFGHDNDGQPMVSEHAVEGFSYSPMGHIQGVPYNSEVHDHPLGSVADVAAVSALCNDAQIVGQDSATSPVDAQVSRNRKRPENEKIYQRVGEPTEAALCVLAEKLGGMSTYLQGGQLDRRGLHLDVPPSVLASANVKAWRTAYTRQATLEFNRDRKSMSVLCHYPTSYYPDENEYHSGVQRRKGGNRLLVKGAPNLLIERCTHIKFRDGTVSKLSAELRREIEAKISDMSSRPLRCLALAVKDYDSLDASLKDYRASNSGDISHHPLLSDPNNYKNVESGLTLVGVVGIKDPARPEVANSIETCTKAGIRVIMITGDARDTAVAIAKDVNIFRGDDPSMIKAFEGREFFRLSEREQLHNLKEGNIVFCRAEPADKQKLVKMLESLGEISSMTGDGVNDAPALQQASIGVAMGITGTEVSKEAADMILADDNFSTIVNAVEEGRRIYANMQAFICFLISCNIGEICAIFFATLAGFPEPLTAMHLLWVNLVTDGPPATALGFNPPSPDLMTVPPRPKDEPIMTRWLLTRYIVTGLYVGIATIGIYVQQYMADGVTVSQLANWSQCGEYWRPAGSASCKELFQGTGRMLPQSLALTTLVCMEMFKALSAVSVDQSILRVGPQSNPWLLAGVAGTFVLHFAVLYSSKLGIPGLGESFGIVPLSTEDWSKVLAWSVPILLLDEILKAIGRWKVEQAPNGAERLTTSTKKI